MHLGIAGGLAEADDLAAVVHGDGVAEGAAERAEVDRGHGRRGRPCKSG
jgi:hypothetical protein